MKNILTIIKKELTRFFTDKRMLLTLILPGIVIYLMYSMMGNFMMNAFTADDDHTYIVYVDNQPEELQVFDTNEAIKIEIHQSTELSEEEIKNGLKNKTIDLYIKYENDFIAKVNAYTASSGEVAPLVEMYYNSVSNESSTIYEYYTMSLQNYEDLMANKFDINRDAPNYDLATDDEKSASIMTMMLPFLLIIFLFSGCMAISVESIAGEKERGTIATLLVTPIKRSELAIGKIVALSITALVSATSSFIGVILSLPKLMGDGANISVNIYGPLEYISIFAVIITTVLAFTVILSIFSSFSKSVKEATTYATPVMIVVMIIGITSMLGGAQTNTLLYLLPIYNSTQCMAGIFGLSFNGIQFLITILSNLAFVGIGVFILTRLFNSEKIMFNK